MRQSPLSLGIYAVSKVTQAYTPTDLNDAGRLIEGNGLEGLQINN